MNLPPISFAANEIPPKEDLDYFAEHLIESALDARYFALPWPDSSAPQDEWRPIVSIGGADFGGDTGKANGGLLTVGLEHPWDERTSYSLLAYYDRHHVYGAGSSSVLTFGTINSTPIDIPERVLFSDVRGRFSQAGLGLVVSHKFKEDSNLGWRLVAGVLLERLNVGGYSFHFRLTSGLDAGLEGDIQFSGDSTFITPFIGAQYVFAVGSRMLLVPRVALGKPLPESEMTMRLTAPGVLLTSDSPGGETSGFGDDFIILGLAIRDRTTNFEFDIGTVLSYPAFEQSRHEGVDDALLITVTWRR